MKVPCLLLFHHFNGKTVWGVDVLRFLGKCNKHMVEQRTHFERKMMMHRLCSVSALTYSLLLPVHREYFIGWGGVCMRFGFSIYHLIIR